MLGARGAVECTEGGPLSQTPGSAAIFCRQGLEQLPLSLGESHFIVLLFPRRGAAPASCTPIVPSVILATLPGRLLLGIGTFDHRVPDYGALPHPPVIWRQTPLPLSPAQHAR